MKDGHQEYLPGREQGDRGLIQVFIPAARTGMMQTSIIRTNEKKLSADAKERYDGPTDGECSCI
jgi:hypothetical protein